MTTEISAKQVRNWHVSIVLLFVFLGAGWTSITTRMPLVKEDLRVTATQLGLILLASGLGSLVGLNIVGRLIARWGTKLWIRVGYPLIGANILLGGYLIQNHFTLVYVFSGIFAGFIMGITDVSINVDGSALEQKTGRTLMPRMHAGYSIGTLIGAGFGSLAANLNIPLAWTAVPLCLVQIVLPTILSKHLPATTGIEAKHTEAAKAPVHWFSFTLVFLGLGILCMTVAEGAANDWLTLGVQAGYHTTGANAGVIFSIFFGGMVVVRFYGGHLADRIGKGNALKLVAAVGVAGAVLVAVGANNLVLAGIGASMWGAGVALGFPLFLSAAGEGENSAKRVSFVASWGYGAFLCGPPLLGFVADHIGMLNMFFVIAGFLFLALLVSGAAGSRKN